MKINFDTVAYNAAIDYVWRNNIYLAGQRREQIKATLDNLIRRAEDPDVSVTSTAGFTVVFSNEGDDLISVDISVDPSLASGEHNFVTQEL